MEMQTYAQMLSAQHTHNIAWAIRGSRRLVFTYIYICKTLLVLFHLLICAYMKTSIIMQICYEFTNYLWGEMTARGVIQSFIHSIITAIAIIVDELWTENRMQPQCAVATLCIARYTVENACALECAWARSHTQDVDEERSHKAVRVHDAVIARRAQTHTLMQRHRQAIQMHGVTCKIQWISSVAPFVLTPWWSFVSVSSY